MVGVGIGGRTLVGGKVFQDGLGTAAVHVIGTGHAVFLTGVEHLTGLALATGHKLQGAVFVRDDDGVVNIMLMLFYYALDKHGPEILAEHNVVFEDKGAF